MQPVDQHVVLGADHVAIAVVRKLRVQPVARLRRLAVPDAVGDHDEVLGRIQQPARHEQHPGELLTQKLVRVAAGPVQYQDGVVDMPVRSAVRRAERDVMQPQVLHHLAVGEGEPRNDVRPVDRRRPRRRERRRGPERSDEHRQAERATQH